jgi:hypothetical protein
MKEWPKAFLSIAAILGGLISLQYFFVETGEWWYLRATAAILGIGLFSAGLTYFWSRTKFYKR